MCTWLPPFSPLCFQVPVTGWLEAIQAHPRLGDIKAVESKQRGSATCFQRETAAEQDNLLAESHDFILMMQELNKSYEDKFGHVFLLFAKGKSPTQVMQCIQERCALQHLVLGLLTSGFVITLAGTHAYSLFDHMLQTP